MSEEKEEKTAKKYEFLEDLPGVGPATAQKLRELGFHTVESLATATIKELEKAGVRKDVKIIVGGAAVTEDFAKKIGADAYGKDAVEAVAICKRLVGVN